MSFTMNKPLLMIPGPMDPPDEVLKRCGMPIVPHYEGDFPAFYDQLVTKMKTIFGIGEGYVFIPNGSGTTAVNMMLASLCTPDDNLLAINNGSFGGYIEKNCKNLGIPFTFVEGEWGTAIDPDKVRDEMKRKRYNFIYITHNESSTAIVNPLEPIGDIAREFDALLLVDSVSGVGGVVIDMDSSGADVVAGASQKCLELPPGLAPVAVGAKAWEYMEKMKNRRVPYFLDFMSWKNAFIEMHDEHPQPVTGATHMLYALDWVVDRIIEEGLENRQERFRTSGERLKNGMAELGFKSGADPRYASPVVTEFLTPGGIPAEDVREFYIKKHNTMVGWGMRKNDEDERISFRVAHFGKAADTWRINRMIAITREFIEE
ncbi:MAG: alanine--glyoxylate aminotransferase family protein [Candidatus Latescibacteria bacterium]|jgi:aspartate aminotransferase-like enzyme|nr:alanine--glyoxylate aminotransferase family protein [Candidatus Latescibacterota bacterium]